MCLVPNQSIPRLKKSRDKIGLFLSDTIAKKAIASRLEHFLSCTKKSSDKIGLFLSDTIAKKAIASRLEHFLSCTKNIDLNENHQLSLVNSVISAEAQGIETHHHGGNLTIRYPRNYVPMPSGEGVGILTYTRIRFCP
ncbi:MAG: hypothetical protein DRR19_32445 [Candidatus Parabeggiatoa sp. nov. 1]|nr:MAG: hypothetical protein DRR19_32445 [Gammaproteobacteria bacterium]